MNDLVAISSPLARPFHFVVLELVVLACTVLVFLHALRAYRGGDRRSMFQWLVITAYGVQMELIAFNFLHNYEHAQFTVQLYGAQLPLYVTGLYGTFLYTGIKLVERVGVHPIAEAFLAGLAICLIDVPFDLAGVAVGWWQWLDTDPNLAFRWLGVPVTSYYWYLIFGAVAAIQCRFLWRLLERRPFALAMAIAPFAGLGVIIFGVLGFLPFHAVAALGVEHGTIVAAHVAGCAVLALAVRGRPIAPSGAIRVVALLLPGWHVLLLAWAALSGGVDDALARLLWSVLAFAGLAAFAYALPLRRTAAANSEPVPALETSVR